MTEDEESAQADQVRVADLLGLPRGQSGELVKRPGWAISPESIAAGTAYASNYSGVPRGILEAAMGRPIGVLGGVLSLTPEEALARYDATATTEGELRLEVRPRKGRLLAETNLTRLPIARPTSPVQLELELEWREVGSLYRRTVLVRGSITVRDMLLYDALTTVYALAGCPPDRRVPFSLGDAARLLGAGSVGGRQRELVKAALLRMRTVGIQSTVRNRDGTEESLTWGLIEAARTTTRGGAGGRGWVRLNEEVARLVADGSITRLDEATYRALVEEDEVAARLWRFLEADSGPEKPSGWSYNLYAAPPGQPTPERALPALADLVRLDWANRRKVALRMRHAAAVLVRLDPRYQATLLHARRQPHMWRLEVHRAPRRGRALPGTPSLLDTLERTGTHGYGSRALTGTVGAETRALTGTIHAALTRVSNEDSLTGRKPRFSRPDVALLGRLWGKKPTAKQVAILDEIGSRHRLREADTASGYAWSLAIMEGAVARAIDPLEELKREDRRLQNEGIAQADMEEAEDRRRRELIQATRDDPAAFAALFPDPATLRGPSSEEVAGTLRAFARDPLWVEGRYRLDELPPEVRDAYRAHLATLAH